MKLNDLHLEDMENFYCSVDDVLFVSTPFKLKPRLISRQRILLEVVPFDCTRKVYLPSISVVFEQIDDRVVFIYSGNRYNLSKESDTKLLFTDLQGLHYLEWATV
jgi:hypothetical protein